MTKPLNLKGDGRSITKTRPDYETVRITPDAKNALIQCALKISYQIGRRVSLTELATVLLTEQLRSKTTEELIDYVRATEAHG